MKRMLLGLLLLVLVAPALAGPPARADGIGFFMSNQYAYINPANTKGDCAHIQPDGVQENSLLVLAVGTKGPNATLPLPTDTAGDVWQQAVYVTDGGPETGRTLAVFWTSFSPTAPVGAPIIHMDCNPEGYPEQIMLDIFESATPAVLDAVGRASGAADYTQSIQAETPTSADGDLVLAYQSQREAFLTQSHDDFVAFDPDAGYQVGAGSIGGVSNAGVKTLTFPAGSRPATSTATVHPRSFNPRRAWWVGALVAFRHGASAPQSGK
ncbi:MAG TPA: hypothetical protein VFM49_18120 [Chloroflexia bacterium]|jgi:hypothetical protein|nr:hypothetical protein [Chloroflexia bacterium]